MGDTPYDTHQNTLADYLAWLTQHQSSGSTAVPVFTWQGSEYACNYSRLQQRDLGAGGYVPMEDLTLEVLTPMPSPGPQSEQMITFEAKEYRIRTVQTAAGKNPKLVCYDPARGS